MIVTFNVKDFPKSLLEPFNIETQTPDVFVLHVVDLAPALVAAVIQQRASALHRPSVTADEVLDRLAGDGLPLSVAALCAELGA